MPYILSTPSPDHKPKSAASSLETEAILATIQVRLTFTAACQQWLARAQEHQLWLARHEGRHFFSQFRPTLEKTLVEAGLPIVQQYFCNQSFPPDRLPQITIREAKELWTLNAEVVVAAKIPAEQKSNQEISGGLGRLQTKLNAHFIALANQRARTQLCFPTVETLLPPPPLTPFASSIWID